MPDQYSTIFGSPTSDEDKQRLIQHLRKQDAMGVLAQLSNSGALPSVGKQLSSSAQTSADRLRRAYQTEQGDIQEQTRYDDKVALEAERYKEKTAAIDAKTKQTQANWQKDYDLDLVKTHDAYIKNQNKDKAYTKLSTKQQDKFDILNDTAPEIIRVIDKFEEGFGSDIGFGAGTISNIVARVGGQHMDESDRKRQQWWADYDLMYTLPERHELFGSALTTNEKASWAAASISKEMSDAQIMTQLKKLRALMRRAVYRMGTNAAVDGVDPRRISRRVRETLNEDEVKAMIGGGEIDFDRGFLGEHFISGDVAEPSTGATENIDDLTSTLADLEAQLAAMPGGDNRDSRLTEKLRSMQGTPDPVGRDDRLERKTMRMNNRQNPAARLRQFQSRLKRGF